MWSCLTFELAFKPNLKQQLGIKNKYSQTKGQLNDPSFYDKNLSLNSLTGRFHRGRPAMLANQGAAVILPVACPVCALDTSHSNACPPLRPAPVMHPSFTGAPL